MPRLGKPHVESVDGTPLFVQDWGSGPVIVFVHAWALNSAIWEYQACELAGRGFRCISFDRRGHGRSFDPGSGYEYDNLADDLASVMKALDVRGATLVGHSMGCGEVARYLARHGSGRVARLVLISTVGPEPQMSNLQPFLNGLQHDRPGLFAAGLPLFFGEGSGASPALVQWVTQQFLAASPRATRECMRVSLTGSLRADFEAIQLPTLLLHGGRDTLNPMAATAEPASKLIVASRLSVYEDAPHGMIITHRDRVTRDLVTFVRDSEMSGSA